MSGVKLDRPAHLRFAFAQERSARMAVQSMHASCVDTGERRSDGMAWFWIWCLIGLAGVALAATAACVLMAGLLGYAD